MRIPVHIIKERTRREQERQRRREDELRLPIFPPEYERKEKDRIEKQNRRRVIVVQM